VSELIGSVTLQPPPAYLVTAGYGLQGPPGPQGPSGAAGITLYVAAAPLSGHIAVVLDATGQITPADASDASHHAVAGLTTQSGTTGASVEVISKGILEHNGWTFTPGAPVFLGLAGAITQTLPPTALFSKVLGVAVSPTRVSVDFQPAIFI
jgi:hypothetical protein